MAAALATSLIDAPDFLRLGLMLTLERRAHEPRGRTAFRQTRHIARQKVIDVLGLLIPCLEDATLADLATYAIAGADGLFIQREVHGDTLDLVAMFELHARSVYDAAVRLSAR